MPLTASNFICFTKTVWFSINSWKPVTSHNFDDSDRNVASDFPCAMHSKTADARSSIILVTVCLHSSDVLLKNFLYKILNQRFGASH